MVKKSKLAAAVVVCLLLCQSRALAQDGLAAYKTLDSGFSSALKAEGEVGGTADIAAYWAWYAIYFANYAYANDDSDYYYWASYCGIIASDFAYQDYEETGNANSLAAATGLYNGAVQAYTVFTNGG